jgi:dihydroxy-acid dehydratase
VILFALDAAGLAKTTAFVTDGQLSGLCLKGLTVAEVHPEAATGGPIGKIRDGDTITISVRNRSIDVDVPADELARRNGPGWKTPATGYLNTFRHDVRDMSTGGVLVPPAE